MNEDKVTFTLTATLRPGVIKKTIESFSKKIIDVDFKKTTCLINIDPAPPGLCNQDEVIDVCKMFFGNVIHNSPQTPSFCASVKWLWSMATTDFVFHLEDDWLLVKEIKLNDLITIMRDRPDLYQIRLRKRTREYGMHQYGLSPCLLSKHFYSKMAESFDIKKNPEKQMQTDYKRLKIYGACPRTVLPYPIAKLDKQAKVSKHLVAVVDIGRKWREKNCMSKPNKDKEIIFNNWFYRKKIIR